MTCERLYDLKSSYWERGQLAKLNKINVDGFERQDDMIPLDLTSVRTL